MTTVIVIVASAFDAHAQGIVAHWGADAATILSAEDLCSPGWSMSVAAKSRNTAVIGGRLVHADEEVTGILTLRSGVFAEELGHVHPEDRSYVTSELNAFLLAWLMVQTCAVLNRPSLSCLAGPNWRGEQWIHAAAGLGIPVRTYRRDVEPASWAAERSVEVICVGAHCFGSSDPRFHTWSRRLAVTAGAELLSARFSLEDGCLQWAHTWPRLDQPAVLDALRERLGGDA
jgi:hypothetical protein